MFSALSQATQVLGFILVLVTAIGGLGRFFIFNPLRREIKDATRQIQKDANGGLSLPDVARKLDKMERRQDDVEVKIDLILTLLNK